MAETIDDSETFTIALTENGEAEPTKTPWALLIAAVAGAYLLLRRK
jgi:hypothetical protein